MIPENNQALLRTFWKAVAALTVCLLLNTLGCSKAEQEEITLPSWLTEEQGVSTTGSRTVAGASDGSNFNAQPSGFSPNGTGLPTVTPGTVGQFPPPQQGGIATASYASPAAGSSLNGPQLESAEGLEKVQLRLNLATGLRLPLKKVIETELTQGGDNGLPEVHRSRLELGMILTVQEKQGPHTRLSVQYNQIKLTREAGGQRLEFDSANPIAQVANSPELLAYKNMVGDGFSYWISDENKVMSLVGFQDFMNRCLGHMPDAAQRAAMLGIEGSSGEDGLADFVDSTIGLLPYNSAKAIGETWSREVSVARPVPMKRTETYTLKSVDPVTAVVQVSAAVNPSTSMGHQMTGDGGVRIVIEGGQLKGMSEIFRDSGLPRHSETTENLNMLVQMAGGVEFRQTKRTTTTISAYPPQQMR